jgi:hypothetical protein
MTLSVAYRASRRYICVRIDFISEQVEVSLCRMPIRQDDLSKYLHLT